MADFPKTGSLIGAVQNFTVDPVNMAAKWFPVENSLSNTYEFDLIEPARGKVGYRLPDGAAGTQAVRSKIRKTVILPTIREKKMLRESSLRWLDAPGKRSPEDAAKAIFAELQDLDYVVERTHEYARWQLLTTGAVTLTGDYTDTYTFGVGQTATAGLGSSPDEWDAPATSDPIGDLIRWKNLVSQTCGVVPDEIIMTSLAVKYIFESTAALAVLGESVKDNFAATGKVPALAGMKVTIMDGGYRDSSDNFKYFCSSNGTLQNMLIMKAPGTLGITAQGPPVDSDAPNNLIGKYAKSWTEPDPAGRWILECHTALPGLTKTNHFGAFTLWT